MTKLDDARPTVAPAGGQRPEPGRHRSGRGRQVPRTRRSPGRHRAPRPRDLRRSDAPQPSQSSPHRFTWAVLSVVLLADVMDLLDSTVANLAGPSIHQDLGGTESALQWVLAAYTFAFAAGLVISGRVGDIIGQRQVFLVGMAGFTLASCVCGLSVSIPMLIAARAAQGLFGAVMIPQGFAMVKASFPPEDLQKAFIPFGPALGLSAVLAPILGGFLLEHDVVGAAWRSLFLINLPIGVFAFVFAFRVLPAMRPVRAAGRIDVVGALLLVLASGLLIYPLVQGREQGWPPMMFGLLALAAVVFALFVWRERSSTDPVIEPSLMGHRGFRGGILVIAGVFLSLTGSMLVVNLFFQLGLGYRPMQAGLAIIPMAFGMSVGAAASGAYFGPRFGRRVLFVGIAVGVFGMLWLWALVGADGQDAGTFSLAPALGCIGLGMGLVFAPLFDIIIADLREHEVGTGSGVLNAVQQYSSAIGVAVLGTVFFSKIGSGGFPGALQTVTLACAAAMCISGVAVLALPRFAREGAAGH
ncbi:MAG: DHA2 family efflux MFS transporter permease subunit [Dermatophilaceae bacterium]